MDKMACGDPGGDGPAGVKIVLNYSRKYVAISPVRLMVMV